MACNACAGSCVCVRASTAWASRACGSMPGALLARVPAAAGRAGRAAAALALRGIAAAALGLRPDAARATAAPAVRGCPAGSCTLSVFTTDFLSACVRITTWQTCVCHSIAHLQPSSMPQHPAGLPHVGQTKVPRRWLILQLRAGSRLAGNKAAILCAHTCVHHEQHVCGAAAHVCSELCNAALWAQSVCLTCRTSILNCRP